jgi:hypothetical protein
MTKYDTAVAAVNECQANLLAELELIQDPNSKLKAFCRVAANTDPEVRLRKVRQRADWEITRAVRAGRRERRDVNEERVSH